MAEGNGTKPFSCISFFVFGSYVLLFGRHHSCLLCGFNCLGIICLSFCCLIHYLSLEPCVSSADCYDPLDPNGNITITYDIQTWTTRGYVVSLILVLCQNVKIILAKIIEFVDLAFELLI